MHGFLKRRQLIHITFRTSRPPLKMPEKFWFYIHQSQTFRTDRKSGWFCDMGNSTSRLETPNIFHRHIFLFLLGADCYFYELSSMLTAFSVFRLIAQVESAIRQLLSTAGCIRRRQRQLCLCCCHYHVTAEPLKQSRELSKVQGPACP